jgi:hypothetical protein
MPLEMDNFENSLKTYRVPKKNVGRNDVLP